MTTRLISMAERAGFSAHVSSPYSNLAFTAQMVLPFDGMTPRVYALCVASLPVNAGARLQPFDVRQKDRRAQERITGQLCEAAARLDDNGLMFVYGLPADLAQAAMALADALTFRYWVAVRAMTAPQENGLRPEHMGLLVMSKPGAVINPLRIPHPRCRHCNQTLKDWGGKSHLMHPEGVRLSDVWMDLVVDSSERMPAEIFERILELAAGPQRDSLLLVLPESAPAIAATLDKPTQVRPFNPLAQQQGRQAPAKPRAISAALLNQLHRAPCLEVLRRIPSESVDLAFADPPFNLTKSYEGYADDLTERDYLGWCKRWLVEYRRVLKPGGALFILNLPKWAAGLADFLLRSGNLYLQNWIVWNSLPEPKGVLMPAHYALLYFTKGERATRFNYCSMEQGWQPFDEAVFPPDRPDVCARRACVRQRRASAHTWRGELTDIWHDIHRERRPIKKSVDEKAHPCATPERLLDRIIRLTTNPGDVVLDAFAGTGTSALVAERLNRRFIAIEQADEYSEVADQRLNEKRSSWQRTTRASTRGAASKRALQLELKRLTMLLGRLPNPADVERLSKYTLVMFERAFDSWSKAMAAARNTLSALPQTNQNQASAEQLEIFAPLSAASSSSDEMVHGSGSPLEDNLGGNAADIVASLNQNAGVIISEDELSPYRIS